MDICRHVNCNFVYCQHAFSKEAYFKEVANFVGAPKNLFLGKLKAMNCYQCYIMLASSTSEMFRGGFLYEFCGLDIYIPAGGKGCAFLELCRC